MSVRRSESSEAAQPVSVRISLTDRCMLRCAYCVPEAGRRAAERGVCSGEDIVRFVRWLRARYPVEKARLTGGEPLLRRDVTDIVAGIVQQGVRDVAVTTNGQRLAAAARGLRDAGLSRVNVSLDTLRPECFRGLAGGGSLRAALAGIDAALECGLAPVKINMVVLRGVNDSEVEDMLRFGLERGAVVRFLEVMPIGPAASRFAEWFVPTDEVRARLDKAFSLAPAPLAASGASKDFAVADGNGRKGTVGFISSCSSPFCEGCRKLRLAGDGRLIGCLAAGDGPLIGGHLRRNRERDRLAVLDFVERTLAAKGPRGEFTTPRLMASVGG